MNAEHDRIIDLLHDEIERLRADKAELLAALREIEVRKGMRGITDALERQAAQIERLRAALEAIAGNKIESRAKLESIARRALEPKA